MNTKPIIFLIYDLCEFNVCTLLSRIQNIYAVIAYFNVFIHTVCIYSLKVIDWLDNHGDGFLRKNTSVGRSLQRAKALQKSHEHFESVAQVKSSEHSQFCNFRNFFYRIIEPLDELLLEFPNYFRGSPGLFCKIARINLSLYYYKYLQ